jgi:YDG domain/HYR domain/MBG domain (YGX type)/Secretion system C-terminal sorting domain/Immunoglobulin I-set domain
MNKAIFTRLTLFFILFLSLAAFKVQGQNAYLNAGLSVPTVTSDKDDYAPGEVAHITGTGWVLDAGQGVHVEFQETPDYPDFHIYDIAINADGSWQIDYPIEVRHVGVRFTVVADGKQSAYRATTIFTDANVTFTATGLTGTPSITVTYRVYTTSSGPSGSFLTKTFNYPGPSLGAISVTTSQSIEYSYSNVTISGALYTAPGGTVSGANNGGGAQTITSAYCTSPLVNAPQPASQSLTYGSNATFTVAATGTATLSYQWQEFTSSWNNITNGGVYSNAATSTLTLTKPTVAMSGRKYRCVVTNTCGNATTDGNATLTVTARSLTVTAVGVNKVYDGTTTATVNLSTDKLAADVVTAAASTATFADKNVGNSKTINVSGISISGADAGNYTLSNTTATATANITVLGITGSFTASNKVYDANNTATVLTRSLAGVISPDVVNLSGGTATFSDKNVANGKTVTLSGAALAGAQSGNYTLSSVSTATANITQLTIVYSITASNKVYDATIAAIISSRTLTGVLSGDIVNTTGSGTATFSDKNVANGKTVTAIGLSIGGSDKDNYTFNTTATALANITKATLVPSIVANNKVYDGTTTATLSSQTVSPILLTDAVSLIVGAANFSDANAGTGKTVTAGSLSLGGVDGGNYILSSVTGTALANITKADATVTVSGYTGVYDAAAHGATGTATGIGGVNLSAGLNLGATFTNVPGGTANWTFTGGTNYNNQSGSVAITINKADPAIVVTPYSVTYDANAHTATGTAKGVVNENLAGLDLSGTTHTNAGTYTDTWTFTDVTGNYNDKSGTVSDVINKKSASVTPNAVSKYCGQSDPVFTGTLWGFITSDGITATYTRTTGETVAGSPYTISASLLPTAKLGNYNIVYNTAAFNITDITAPVISALPAPTTINCPATPSFATATATDCSPFTLTYADVTTPGSCAGNYSVTRTWTAVDGSNNQSTKSQTINVQDIIAPVITGCPGNIILNACTPTATWTEPTANDVCSGAVTPVRTGPAPGSTFLPGTTTTISYKATDACGNFSNCSFTVTRAAALSATCSNNNPVLYFGYTLDQSAVITVKPAGGVGPYKVSITMNRPINCNMINSSGDEVWAPGANTFSNSYITCPSSGPSLSNPISTSTSTITAAVGYSLTVTLMQDAVITATITDANGCTTTCTTNIHAEDVRCFAGNSSIVKITLCHRTGSTSNPCVTICVDQNAVSEHLGHGDFLGKCTPGCIAPATRPVAAVIAPVFASELTVKVMPNPSPNYFNVAITGKNNTPVTVRVLDIYGRLMQLDQKIAANSTLRLGQKWTGGTYFVEVMQGEERKVVKVIKAN